MRECRGRGHRNCVRGASRRGVAAAEAGGLHGSSQWRRSMEIVAHRRRPLDRLGLRRPPIPDGYFPGLTPGIDMELVVWLMYAAEGIKQGYAGIG